MDIIRAGQRPDPRRRWEESTQPDEMLALLRDACKTRPLPANNLRLFASRCARQRGSDAYIHTVLSALGSIKSLDVTPESSASLASLRAKCVAVADESTHHLDTPQRRVAARHLAAFNTLLDNPIDAAVGASGYMIRHGASDEADLRAMREEQVVWLRELFEAPAALVPEPPPRIDRPWEGTDRPGGISVEFIRALRGRGRVLVARDPWIPVPQRGCNYGFGFDARPLPIGALAHFWAHWPAMHGRCPLCGGEVFGYMITAMLSAGGIKGCCLVCEREVRRPIGSVVVLGDLVKQILSDTPYQLEAMGMSGAYPGNEDAFFDALAELDLERVISNEPSSTERGTNDRR